MFKLLLCLNANQKPSYFKSSKNINFFGSLIKKLYNYKVTFKDIITIM